MFAIVDIETTGGSPEYGHKITDICILIHDGLSVVDKFSTLINPERVIPDNIIRLTGITNEMVRYAPPFYEVAKQIIEFTEGKIFVAHNVSFDYGFVRHEYESLGYKFSRDKLCTVRLSRKLLPQRVSYSLGRLCDSLGIQIESRHRAEGDAVATAKLFDILLAKKSEHPLYRRHNIDEINTTRIDNIKKYILKKLPEETGVYYFLDQKGNILYIGKSKNARDRAMAHFNNKTQKAKKLLQELYNVDFVPTGSELIALLLESEEIKKNRPRYNKLRKAEIFTHSIDTSVERNGAISFSIVPYDEAKQPLLSFINYFTARERLEEWMEEHTLCQQYCGLSEPERPCFHHSIKRCNGICCSEESVEQYNLRAKKILSSYRFKKENFLIVDKGRNMEEQSVVLVEQGKYAGYGYIDQSCSVFGVDDLKSYITRTDWYPDSNDLIRGWLKNKNVKTVPF